jgi:hypothetical protein
MDRVPLGNTNVREVRSAANHRLHIEQEIKGIKGPERVNWTPSRGQDAFRNSAKDQRVPYDLALKPRRQHCQFILCGNLTGATWLLEK